MPTVLIADDNTQIVSVLNKYLLSDGYHVLTAYDGLEALSAFQANSIDIVLLDVMMPKMDGFAVCREIRKASDVPILMITARSEDFERIMGLDIGADDYIVKPFSPGEVMARIRAVLRRLEPRERGKNADQLTVGSLAVDIGKYSVTVSGMHVTLTKRAIEILWTLAGRPDQIFTRELLLDTLWGKDYFGDIRTVDSQIKRMRATLSDCPHPDWEIKTIWGVGYKFERINETNFKN
ncbi:MAG: response regulator transcription factor [Clostridia bacterium]